MKDSHANLLPLSLSGPGESLRDFDLSLSSCFFFLTALPERRASSSASESAFAVDAAIAACSCTSVWNISSMSSILRSMTSGLGLSTTCTLPDESDFGVVVVVVIVALGGDLLRDVLTQCSSMMSGSVALINLEVAL